METTCFRITIVIILVIGMLMTTSHVISTMVTTTDIIIRQTTTRDREDNHQIETILRMIATDLREGRTEIVIDIITTILRTPEIIMMGGRIRTQISQARTTSVERRITTLLEIVIEMMTNNLMTNRERPTRGSQNDPQFIRIFPITCVEPLNTSAASADPTPEVVNTSQPDQQNRVGGSFNTVRYERADALKQVSFKTTRAEVLQIIANLRSVFSTYHHSECIAVE